MRPIVTDQVAWSVGLSVGWSVIVTVVSPAKRLNRSRCRLGYELRWAKEACIRWGPDPYAQGKFFYGKGHAWACPTTFCYHRYYRCAGG